MGKDATEKKVKKDKKEKKERRQSDIDGVKKSKKEKKSKLNGDVDIEMTDALEVELQKEPEQSAVKLVDAPTTALVPFAEPLAQDAKEVKKVLRTVKKSAKSKTLRRGVKEVVKYLRKSPTNAPSSSDISNPSAVVIIAADISPMDVISHIPVLCEDHNIPYLFVKSRVELGEASATKRPTSVVLVAKERSKKGKDMTGEEKEEWDEAWDNIRTVVVKASKTVTK
ncbi:L30e-like protein [Periconia macrospinosa]|uniref:L30e-like protein n=1 Tax=Periconia macrospinosa TaxID=97972 RepID=A0A2V1E4F3_9PLEO|nr:L30e-like protein [Periconia macrospinosa]